MVVMSIKELIKDLLSAQASRLEWSIVENGPEWLSLTGRNMGPLSADFGTYRQPPNDDSSKQQSRATKGKVNIEKANLVVSFWQCEDIRP